jgi:hypothetical protein
LRYFHFSPSVGLPWTAHQYRPCAAAEPYPHAGVGAALPDRDGFIAQLTLPISSERLPDPPSREIGEAVARSNASVLAFLSQEIELAAMPRTADDRLAMALAPLRTRLDMLIEMVARLTYRDIALPPVVPVALSPSRIIWHSRQHWLRGDWLRLDMLIEMVARLTYRDIALPPVVPVALSPSRIIWHSRQHWRRGDWLRLELYFHPIFREAVSLLLQVTDCVKGEREEFWQVEGSLVEMPGSTREGMTRLAFLTHRQQRARHRSQNMATGQT